MKIYWPMLLFYGLSVYRLALMLSSDVGPWGAFAKLRSFLKREAKINKPLRDSKVHIGIECIRCDSVWVALPVAIFAANRHRMVDWVAATGDVFLSAMSLSALAIIFNHMFPKR